MHRVEQRVLEWITRDLPLQDALCGDIHEEFARRRSRRWLWRQLASAGGAWVLRHARVPARARAEHLALNLALTGVLRFATYVTWLLGDIVFHAAWSTL